MSRRRLTLGIGAYAFDKLVVALVQILTVPVLANAWGLTLYGVWTMVMTIPTFLVLGDFGIVNSAGARMIMHVARGDWDKARATLHTAWLATLAIVALVAAVLAAVLWWLPDGVVPVAPGFGEADSRTTVLVLLVYGLVTIVFRLNAAAFRAAMLYTPSLLIATLAYLVENLAVVVLAATGFRPVVVAFTLLTLRLAALLGIWLAGRAMVPRLRPGFAGAAWSEWGAMWGPALAASALGFGLAAYLQGSVMILGVVAGAAAIPAFTATRTLSRLGVQVATLFSLPVSQEFGNAMGRDEFYRAGRFFGLVFVPALLMSGAAGLGLALLGGPFIHLWTHGAITADPGLLVFMAISSFAAMFWNPLSNLILAINRQKSYSYANLAISAVGLVQIWIMAGRQGAAAAGLSFAVVDGVTLAAVVLFIWRNWLVRADFRDGVAATMRELRAPLALLRSLRRPA